MKIKIYTRFDNLNNQGQGRICLDIIKALKEHKIIINKCLFKSNIGYVLHSTFIKLFDFRKADVNIAITSMESLYLNPKKSIVIIHDLIPLLHQFETLCHYNNNPLNQILSLSFFYITLRQAIKFKKIIVISEKTKNELFKIFPELEKEKVVLINNNVQEKYVPQTKVKKDKLRLYTVSVLDHRKRTIELIKWFNEWNPSNIQLYIGGKGSLLDEAKRLSDHNNNIHILGEIPENEMVKRYKEADIILFPTKNEGFGLPIIEGVNCNRPVITLRDSKIPYEVKECSFVANDWDDMKKLILINKFDNKSKLKKAQKFKGKYIKNIRSIVNEFV